MKKGLAILVLLSLVLMISPVALSGCERSVTKVSFADLIANPAVYAGKSENVSGGVVVYQGEKDKYSIAVATSVPLPPLKNGNITDNDVIAIKMATSAKINVGDIVNVSGNIKKVTDGTVQVYHIDASKISVVGMANTTKQDFEDILTAVQSRTNNEVIGDNTSGMLFLWFWLFIVNPAMPSSPFYSGYSSGDASMGTALGDEESGTIVNESASIDTGENIDVGIDTGSSFGSGDFDFGGGDTGGGDFGGDFGGGGE